MRHVPKGADGRLNGKALSEPPVGTRNANHQYFQLGDKTMANSRSLQQAVRWALALATASAGVTGANAQTAPAQPAEATAAPLQEVVVTGSRLKPPNEASINQITS